MNHVPCTRNRGRLAASWSPRLQLCVVLSTLTLITGSRAESAPVTFRFDATVGPPRQSFDGMVPPGWNISLQEGDIISGTYTFEPHDVAPDVSHTTLVQPYDFSIYIKSQMLTTSQYGMDILNNVMTDEVPESRDRISIACSAGANTPSCVPAAISAPELLAWEIVLGFEGSPSILDGADVPADILVWRDFSLHSLLVTLIDNSAHRSYGFLAMPTSIDAIPEPDNCFQLIFVSMLLVLSRHCADKRRPLFCIWS
jgi:hypothetical protein